MNCRQGDLAVVVRALVAENLGKVCMCQKLVHHFLEFPDGSTGIYACWETDQKFVDWRGREGTYIEDVNLRPLRDQPGQDESLSWAGKPKSKSQKKPTPLGELLIRASKLAREWDDD